MVKPCLPSERVHHRLEICLDTMMRLDTPTAAVVTMMRSARVTEEEDQEVEEEEDR